MFCLYISCLSILFQCSVCWFIIYCCILFYFSCVFCLVLSANSFQFPLCLFVISSFDRISFIHVSCTDCCYCLLHNSESKCPFFSFSSSSISINEIIICVLLKARSMLICTHSQSTKLLTHIVLSLSQLFNDKSLHFMKYSILYFTYHLIMCACEGYEYTYMYILYVCVYVYEVVFITRIQDIPIKI